MICTCTYLYVHVTVTIQVLAFLLLFSSVENENGGGVAPLNCERELTPARGESRSLTCASRAAVRVMLS